ncbi:MAG: hypothetical protein ACO1QS_03165 [Verrucomicrobiota bacterium]
MHILIRKISPYTGADILLGVFTDAASAEFTRSLYWNLRAGDAEVDPWYNQSYRPPGLQSEDLVAAQIKGPEFKNGETVFVLSRYMDGMGQKPRMFLSLHKDAATAQTALAQAEASIGPYNLVNNYYSIQEAKVGEMLSDAREEQPRPI